MKCSGALVAINIAALSRRISMRLFAFALIAGILSASAFAQDSCDFLHEQTQAFSDAGQRGDGAAMARMLDPDVIFFNETGEMKFRSVETWRKEGDSWMMIGSETLTLQQDPDPVVLGGKAMNEYTGVYEAGANMRFTFALKGNGLVASLNGAAETVQKAQARDIFFTPGHGTTPKVFQRGHDGKIASFIYLRGKNSIVFKRVV
jgi:hypothetical protein